MIINLTWHNIKVKTVSWDYKTIKSSGNVRMSYSTIDLEPIDWIKITQSYYGWWVALPSGGNDTIYIVSKIVCEQNRNRKDFYIVNQKSWSWASKRAGSLSPNPYADV